MAQGEMIAGLTFEDVIEKLKAAARPLNLVFENISEKGGNLGGHVDCLVN